MLKKLFATFLAAGIILCGSAFAANSVTLRSTVPLTNGTGANRGTLYEYLVTLDTGSSALTIQSAVTGKYLAVVGFLGGVSSNASYRFISNSVHITGGTLLANTALFLPYRCGQVLAIGTLSQDISITASAALTNNTGSVFILEATAEELARYLQGC